MRTSNKLTPTSLQQYQRMRNEPESFYEFCDVFLKLIVGVSIWKYGVCHKTVSELATPSDEAFALLLLENTWDQWFTRDLAEYKNERKYNEVTGEWEKRKPVYGKWTRGAGGEPCYGGWTEDGVNRFNELCILVNQNRVDNHAVEVAYMHRCKERAQGKGVARVETPTRQRVVAAYQDDLSDLLADVTNSGII